LDQGTNKTTRNTKTRKGTGKDLAIKMIESVNA
jgi:hypothetical protein